MRSRLRLEELSEGRVIHLAVEGGLKAHGLQAQVEKRSRAPLRAGACLAPRLFERGPIELQVEAQVVGDGKWGSLIEISDEVGGDGGLASVLAPRLPDRLGLFVDPPGGRKAEKGDVLGIGGRGSGALVGSGVGHEDRPVGALLAAGTQLPEIVGEDVGQQLDAERTTFLTFP